MQSPLNLVPSEVIPGTIHLTPPISRNLSLADGHRMIDEGASPRPVDAPKPKKAPKSAKTGGLKRKSATQVAASKEEAALGEFVGDMKQISRA